MTRTGSGLLAGLGLLLGASLFAGLVAGAFAFLFAYDNAERFAVISAERVIGERADRQSEIFDDVSIAHETADAILMQRFEALEGIDVDAVFDRLYPLQEDGTRRSRPEYFDGYRTPGGAFVEGMGAFIPNPETLDEADKRILIAAFQTVHEFGAGMRGSVDNFYFFTPNDSLVIYAPFREDRLIFYRETAPADFSFRDLPMSDLVSPELNPSGRTACTGLENVVYQRGGASVSTGCTTPVRSRETQFGAFGNSIYLHTWLMRTVMDAPEGSQNVIIDDAGDVIAHESLLTSDAHTDEEIRTANALVGSADLLAIVTEDGREAGAMIRDGQILSFARIDAPGWYFINSRPAGAITANALKIGVWAFALTALFVGLFSLLLAGPAKALRERSSSWWHGVMTGNEYGAPASN